MNTTTTTTTSTSTATMRGSIANDERKNSIDLKIIKLVNFARHNDFLLSIDFLLQVFFVVVVWSTFRSSDIQIIESTSKIILNIHSILSAIGFAVNHFDDFIDRVKCLRMRIFHSKKKKRERIPRL